MDFMTSDMELTAKATELIRYEDYAQTRGKYQIHNPRRYVSAETHRRIMGESIRIAKMAIDRGGTEEEVRNACCYLYICMDAKKYRLDWNKARRDLQIDDLKKKYVSDEPTE